jgi:undecaprenyl pyrophosphate synthase
MTIKEDFGKIASNNYEEEIDNVSVYLNSMEEFIQQKIELFKIMKNTLDKVKNNVKNAEELTAKLRY